MKKNDCQKVRSGKKWLLLWLLLFLPFWGLAQSNSASLTWNTQVGCIEYGSEVEDPKDPREPGNGVVFESLPPGQACQKVCEGSTVVYSVQGNNIAQVTWSAAGGNITSSSNSSATVQWGAHGSASLQITVTYADNTQQTSTLCLQKINRPNANFKLALGQEPQVCVNTQVYFDNLSDDNGGSAIVHYEWAVQGPGIDEIFSTAYEPSYTFTQAGTYTVFLTVTNSCNCKSQVYKMDIEVESAPPIDITCKSVVCEGSTEKYIANNVCGGDWNVVGGTIVNQNGNIIEVLWDQVDPADGFGYVMYKSECGCSAWTTV
ncbi:PKD domain-containing protein [Chryseobacterium sp.]|uniref:PKD domain-containing protein n=1 Tax=Chryseobacterium sp. TaxID=1871047 RepID=UPI0012A799B8|nr:PKD domain-containing protein [Chryseobacterium sp.]QFG53469.1 PKD domain-containing protein [Chryseobacterium sp.]